MNFKTRRDDDVNPNLTPLIDVVFLLLIFFMVSTTFEQDSEISITLPTASKETPETKLATVNIGVDAKGVVSVNRKILVNAKVDSIRDAISDATKKLESPTVVINADAAATHQSVIRIMDAARQLNLYKVTFRTQILTN